MTEAEIRVGHVLDVLAEMEPESVSCVVTSPPYWSLRRYDAPDVTWPRNDPDCEHEWSEQPIDGEGYTGTARWQHTENGRGEEQPTEKRLRDPISREARPEAWSTDLGAHGTCSRCGAWRGQLGLEPTPAMYIEHSLAVLRAIRRVLRPDGVVFWNLSGGYLSGGGPSYDTDDTEPEDWLDCDSVSRRRDGGHQDSPQSRRSPGSDDQPQHEPPGEAEPSSPAHKGSSSARRESLDSASQVAHTEGGSADRDSAEEPAGGVPRGVQASTKPDASPSSRQTVDARGSSDSSASPDSSSFASPQSSRRAESRDNPGRAQTAPPLGDHSSDRRLAFLARRYSSTARPKAKDLDLIPESFILAAREDGWWVRSRIAWTKTNAMPESAKDRPTSAWEHIYMLTKSARYWWDGEAVREPHKEPERSTGKPERSLQNAGRGGGFPVMSRGVREYNPGGRSLRDVWTFPTAQTPEAHFATFPEELPRRCILAACPPEICAKCGTARVRQTEATFVKLADRREGRKAHQGEMRDINSAEAMGYNETATTGWTSCDCPEPDYQPGLVLDPFAGIGTTGVVARRLGRRFVGIELSEKYAAMARDKLRLYWRKADLSEPEIPDGQPTLPGL